MNEQTMPATLTVSEVRHILKVGTNTAYNLIHSKAFPVKRVGRSFRVPYDPFLMWLSGSHPELAVSLTSKSQTRI